MKILFLPVYHYPEKAASLYMGENAREAYAAQGWKMKIICPCPSRGVDVNTRKSYIESPDTEELSGAVKVRRFRLFREGKNIFMRALRYVICQMKQYRYAIKENDTDVLFVSSTPPIQGLLMMRVKKKLGCKTIYNLQDIFPDSLINAGLTHRGSLAWRIGRTIENKTYKYADKIIVISEGFKKNIMEKGVPEEKIELIPNWVDEAAITPIKREDNPLFDRLKLDRACFYVVYSGNIGKSQNIEMLLKVAELLIDEKDIRFVVIGNGVCRDELFEKSQKRNLDNIRLIDFLPYNDISYVFGLGDVGLVMSKAGIGGSSVPSKAWSIMCAERPILASFDHGSELESVIKKAECGVCVSPDDATALASEILLMRDDPERCKSYGSNGRKYVLENLTKERGCSKLVQLIESIIS